MASYGTVKVHPLVYMTIVDSYEKSFKKDDRGKNALGTLVGFRENDVIQVTDCYAIPFDISVTEGHGVDDAFNRAMWNPAKRIKSSETIVGWFFTVSEIPGRAQQIHKYFVDLVGEFSVKKEDIPVLLLTMDASFSSSSIRLPVKGYIGRLTMNVSDGQQRQAYDFCSQKVELVTLKGEGVLLDCITKGKTEIWLDDSKDLDRLCESTNTMVVSLEKLLDYVDKVLKLPSLPADSTIGQKLMKIVDGSLTQFEMQKTKRLGKNSAEDYSAVNRMVRIARDNLSIQDEVINMHFEVKQ
uniref:MPN domain-containing protein n=1 Tax=Ditylenchus dipsaci TaxID=166011 RepID=A0A915DE24_9BILA